MAEDENNVGGGDGEWATAPNTPTQNRPKSRDRLSKSESYEIAVMDSDWYWEWRATDLMDKETSIHQTDDVTESKEGKKSHPAEDLPSKKENMHDRMNLFCLPATSVMMSSSYPTASCSMDMSRGNSSVQSAHPTDLSINGVSGRHEQEVITTPPVGSRSRNTSGSNLKPKSIEEMSQSLADYVPSTNVNAGIPIPRLKEEQNSDSPEPNPFCFSYLTKAQSLSPVGDSKQGDEGFKHLSDAPFDDDDDVPLDIHGLTLTPDMDTSVATSLENVYADFLKNQLCYDVVPISTKIVVFDTRLRVKKAFFALVANGIRSAPLWDSNRKQFVGMLTITDFINILRYHYKSPIVRMDEFEEQTIHDFRCYSEGEKSKLKSTLVRIDPMESLYDAAHMLLVHKIHRLPVIDSKTGNALYILTHKRILHFLYHNLISVGNSKPSYMSKPIGELGIGTYSNIATGTPDLAVIAALNVFAEKRVSALPIVSLSGQVVDIYAKFDVINLAVERTYNNLDVGLSTALKHRTQEGVHTCKASDSLDSIITKIVSAKVHRLVIVDDNKHVVGVVSLSDILKFLILIDH